MSSIKSPDDNDIAIGRLIRAQRLVCRMSQTELANKVGVTFQQVQKYEKGVNRISASRLREMSHVLQVPVQFFFDGLPEAKGGSGKERQDPSQKFVHDFLASSDGLALARVFTRLKSSKLRRRIVQLVKEFVDEAAGES